MSAQLSVPGKPCGTRVKSTVAFQPTNCQFAGTPVRAREGSNRLEPLVATAALRAATTTATTLAGRVAVPAENRTIATRLEWHCCRLAATRANYRCTLCRSRTVAGTPPLIVLFCLTAVLATLWGRITAFLKERLISSGEKEILSTIAASKLNISGHGSPRGDCTAQVGLFAQGIF